MRYIVQIVLLASLVLLFGACSLQKDAVRLYQQETPLEVSIILPEDLSLHQPETIQAVLTQGGKRVEHAKLVHFEIWKRDGSLSYPMVPARNEGDGIYSLHQAFEQEGVYVVKVHAESQGSMAMPRKQFVVGNVSKEELELLQEAPEYQDGHTQHH